MRTRLSRAVMAAAAGLAVTALLGCGQFSGLKAKMALKDATVRTAPKITARRFRNTKRRSASTRSCPQAYFYLANSYDNLWKPAKKGEAANDALLTKAIAGYKTAAEKSEDPKLKKLSLEYLVAAYRDKMEDPSQAEPVVERMIQMEPNEPTNYFALSKIYEDAGKYEEAEATLVKARDARPKDPTVYSQLASYYNRQGQFDKTIESLEARAAQIEPNNPEAYYTISTYYWDKAFRDFRLKEPEKREYVQKGIDAADRALKIKGDYMEAIVYKGLLLRLAANMEKDRGRQEQYLKEADQLRDKAKTLQKTKSAGAGAGAGAGD